MAASEPDDVLAPVFALIAERRRALDELEGGLLSYRKAFAGDAATAPATVEPATRRTPVAGGSVHDRILGLLRESGEPLAMPAFLKGAKAKAGSVRAAVQQLLDGRRIVRTGQSRGTKYALVK